MGCQRDPDERARARHLVAEVGLRVRLTDQALVAVAVARRVADPRDATVADLRDATVADLRDATVADLRDATVADLVVGLATEPDGVAGTVLRRRPTAAVRLTERTQSTIPGLPSLERAVVRAAEHTEPRPADSAALLAAALEVGGTDLADLLTACGHDPSELYRAATGSAGTGGTSGLPGAGETFGLGADTDLMPDAAVAVARVRAVAGGAVELVLAIAALPAPPPRLPADENELAIVRDVLHRRGDAVAAGDAWDRGLDVVLAAARGWRRDEPVPVSALDLLRAALVVGGQGPEALLDEAARREEQRRG